MTQVRAIPWDDYEVALPAFLTVVLMPFTFSITNGTSRWNASWAWADQPPGSLSEPGSSVAPPQSRTYATKGSRAASRTKQAI